MKRKSVVFCVLALTLLSGCSTSTNNTMDSVSSSIDMVAESSSGSGVNEGFDNEKELVDSYGDVENTTVVSNRKVIKKADLNLETDNFSEVIGKVEDYIGSVDGYIESSNSYQEGINSGNYKSNRTAEFIIRVPQENFERILNECGNLGVVTNKRVYGDDVSSDYFDKESRLEVLKAQESKYLEILNKAATVTEVIEVERVLTEVRYEIEYLTGYLKKIDNLTNLSTINLNVNEVYKTNEIISEPKTLGEKIVNTFNESIKALESLLVGVLLFAIATIPFLIIPAIICIITFSVYKNIKKNKKVIRGNKEENK